MESLRCLAVVPVYEAMTGNICIYYGFKGEAEQRTFTVRTQIRRFFREHRMDEKEYLHKARQILGIKKQIPLAFLPDCIFLPIKVRIPVARGDGAYAYVRYEGIRNLSDNQLLLTTGEPLDCLQSKRSLQEAMARAHALQSVLKSEEACRNAERKLLRLEMLEAKKILKDLTK